MHAGRLCSVKANLMPTKSDQEAEEAERDPGMIWVMILPTIILLIAFGVVAVMLNIVSR